MNETSVIWNYFLIVASVFNLFLLSFFILFPKLKKSEDSKGKKIGNHWCSRLYYYQHWLVMIYTLACAVRSIWPRHDGERICFYDSPLSYVIVGRSLATIAELSFMAQLSIIISLVINKLYLADIWFSLNIIAQSCCWFSVLTQDQRGHVIEESIWMMTVFSMIIVLTNFFFFEKKEKQLTKSVSLFIKIFLCCGILYVIFMCYIDIPMYFNRYLQDSLNNRRYKSFSEGFDEINRCLNISKDDTVWKEEIPWMTAYFTFAVWSSMLMSKVSVDTFK
jgi:hypothetical protein